MNQNDQSYDSNNIQQIDPCNHWIIQHRVARRKRQEQEEELRIRAQGRRMFRMKPHEFEREIEQAYRDYDQNQVMEHEKWLDLEVQWLEDDYKEQLQQIEHLEELKQQQEQEQQNETEQMKQFASEEQWEKKLLEYLVKLKNQ